MSVYGNPVAPLVIYDTDIMLAANQRQSLLPGTVTSRAIDTGSSYIFEIADATYSYAKERAPNSNIPVGNFTQTQKTATISTLWSEVFKSLEEVKGSQGDLKRIMVEHVAGEIARTEDKVIFDTLDASATEFDSSAVTASADVMRQLLGQLLKNRFKMNGEIFAVVGPSAWVQLLNDQDFKNSLISGTTPTKDLDLKWDDTRRMYSFSGINIVVHSDVPGVGTALETNFLYHKTSVGSVYSKDQLLGVNSGYIEHQGKYYAIAGVRTGSAALQTTGMFKFYTNGLAS